MSDEEDAVGNDIDRVLRAAVMGASQITETVQRRRAEKDRQQAEQWQQQTREQQDTTRLVLDRVQRDSFWRTADGERVANAATYTATLADVDPRAKEAYQVVREQTQELYGINLDQLRAQFPGSEDKRQAALLHAVDDFLNSTRAEREATADRGLGTDLENDAVVETATSAATEDLSEGQVDESNGPIDDGADGGAEGAFSDARGHELERDEAQAHAGGDEAFVNRSGRAVVAAAELPRTPAGLARRAAGQSFPESAATVLTGTRSTRQPRSRASKPQKVNEREGTLTK